MQNIHFLNKSKLISNSVRKDSRIESYHVEICDGQVQHWVFVKDGYLFSETETISICGFNVREINKMIKNIEKS